MEIFKNWGAQKALIAQSKGKTDEAYEKYTELYNAGKLTSPRHLIPYSLLLLRRGEYERTQEALKKAEKAGGLTPDSRQQLLIHYAIASWKLGKLDYAIKLLEELHHKKPNGLLYDVLGVLKMETGDVEEALRYNKEAVEYDDEDAVALDNLGQCYYRLLGDKETAKPYFVKAHEEKAEAIDTNYFLALYDIEAGNMEDAKAKLDVAAKGKFSPLNFATLPLIAEALAKTGL